MLDSVLQFGKTAFFSVLSVFGYIGEEQPKYDVRETVAGDIQIRAYAPRLIAETTVDAGDEEAQNAAFFILAGYIFGENVSGETVAMTSPVEVAESEKVAMTAPVEISGGEGEEYTMRFFLPSEYTVETAPTPLNEAVVVRLLPEMLIAARSVGGRVAAAEAKRDQLLADLEGTGYAPVGPAAVYGYNSPFTIPFLRTTEVVVEVAAD